MLKGIRIQNFAILQDLCLGRDPELLREGRGRERELTPVTTLIGRNGTGKSAVFEAVSLLRDIQLYGLPFASSGRRGGLARLKTRSEGDDHAPIRFQLIFEREEDRRLLYELELALDEHNRPYIASESLNSYPAEGGGESYTLLDMKEGSGYLLSNHEKREVSLLDSKQTALSLYGRMLQYHELCWVYLRIAHWYNCRINSQLPPATSHELGGHKHLNENCDNIKNVLRYIKNEDHERYEAMLKRIAAKIPDYQKLGDDFLDFDINTGNMKLFTLLLLLEDPRPLICLDEPDNGLYHDMIEALILEMRDYIYRNPESQIFLSTHNTTLLSHLKPSEVWVMELKGERGPDIRRADEDPIVREMYREGIDMGMLWYGGHLGIR